MSGITHYLSFHVWCVSLGVASSGFAHVIICVNSLSLFYGWVMFRCRNRTQLFFHLSVVQGTFERRVGVPRWGIRQFSSLAACRTREGSLRTSLLAQMVKNLPPDARDLGSIPGLGRSPGGGYGNPLQYPCLENSMDRGAWQATVHGVIELDTTEWLSTAHSYPGILRYQQKFFTRN